MRKAAIGYWLLAIGSALSRPASAQQNQAPPDSEPTLEERVYQLDQEIRILKRLQELARDSMAAAARERPNVAAGKEGFNLKSADGKYSIRFRGYLQSDGRFYPGAAAASTDNLLIRRARPILEATAGRYFEFRLMPDFGGSSPTVFDAYWEAKLVPAFSLRAGKFKPPIGLERLQSATDIGFAERGLPTNLVPSRDIGLQVWGEIGEAVLSYQVGVFNGVPDLANGGDDLSNAKDFAGRILAQPFRGGPLKGLAIGVGGSTGFERGAPASPGLPSYRTPGQQTFFRYRTDAAAPANNVFADGRRTRLSPQGYFYTGPFGLLGEYVLSRNQVTRSGATIELEHHAWQAAGSFFLTGEKAGFRAPAPRKPFDLKDGGFGALELVARYGEVSLDEAAFPVYANPASSAENAASWGLGINWHFTRSVKLSMSYDRATFVGGAAGGDREPENFMVTRFQHSF